MRRSTVYKYGNTLKKRLVKSKRARQVDVNIGAGVYLISCREGNLVYIGETGCDFEVKLGKYKSAVTHWGRDECSFQHLNTKKCAISWKKFKCLSFGRETKPLSRH